MNIEQCPRCFGRGYIPEKRKPSRINPHGLGFYARTCARCGGRGFIETKADQPKKQPGAGK